MMRKIDRFLLLLLVMVLVFALPVLADSKLEYVTDQAEILTEDEEAELKKTAEEIAEEYGVGIYIITVDDFTKFSDEREIFYAADEMYDEYQLGVGKDRDGLLLLLSMDERDYSVNLFGPKAEEAFTDYGLTEMEEAFLASFRSDDWMGGFETYQKVAKRYLKLAAAGTPYDREDEPVKPSPREDEGWHFPVFGVLVIPTALAFILCGIWKGQMKSVHTGRAAMNYVGREDIQLTRHGDYFTHTTQTRTRIQSDEHRSGGGGGGMMTGSHGTSGHSGKF